jgi:hypothetical protein
MAKAASSTAVAPPPGMPSASMVAIAPPSELEFAPSAAITPFGLPLPKLSPSGALRLVSA